MNIVSAYFRGMGSGRYHIKQQVGRDVLLRSQAFVENTVFWSIHDAKDKTRTMVAEEVTNAVSEGAIQ